MNKLDVKNYIDITKEWLENATPNSHVVKDLSYFNHNDIKYYVDGKNVVLDYKNKELEIVIWLENTFGGEIFMLPRINKPDRIKTADYLWNGEYWDLKEIFGSGKNILYHAIEYQRKQAPNFIFDFSNSKLSIAEIYVRVEKLFQLKKLDWLNTIIVKKHNNTLFILKKQPLRLTVGPLRN